MIKKIEKEVLAGDDRSTHGHFRMFYFLEEEVKVMGLLQAFKDKRTKKEKWARLRLNKIRRNKRAIENNIGE